MDGGVVVEGLDRQVVLVGDAGVVDVDEAVGGAGEEDGWGGGVEGEGGDVVGVDFGVGCFWGGGGSYIPDGR